MATLLDLFCINAGAPPPGFYSWTNVVPNFLPDGVSSQFGIYDDTTIYSYLNNKSERFYNVKLAADKKTKR